MINEIEKIIEEIEFDCSAVDDYATVWKAIDSTVLKKRLVELGKKKEYESLIAEGLSDSEARGTVWPDKSK